jgi:hypothetical protein
MLLMVVLQGCSGAADPGIPKGASLVAEMTGPAGSRGDRYTPLQADTNGALYIFDTGQKQIVYSGAVEQGNQIRLYPGGVAVVSILPGRSRTAYEHWVTRFDVGSTYHIYYEPGGMPVNPTTEAQGSPLTRPYQERTIERRPTEAK